MRSELERFIAGAVQARSQAFKAHPFREFVRRELANAVRASLVREAGELTIEGHSGNGAWAFSPWVGIRHEHITREWMAGPYVCYLLREDGSALVLSLQIGTERERRAGGAEARIRREAEAVRTRVPLSEGMSHEPMSLRATTDRSRSYEWAHVLGKTYPSVLPDEATLHRDLLGLVRSYLWLAGDEDVATPEMDMPNYTHIGVEDRRRLRVHVRAERNSALAREAKRRRGYRCEACGFCFKDQYAGLEDYIEAHHREPFARLPTDRPVALSADTDFAVLCSNCHRAIHLMSPLPSVEEFRARVQRRLSDA